MKLLPVLVLLCPGALAAPYREPMLSLAGAGPFTGPDRGPPGRGPPGRGPPGHGPPGHGPGHGPGPGPDLGPGKWGPGNGSPPFANVTSDAVDSENKDDYDEDDYDEDDYDEDDYDDSDEDDYDDDYDDMSLSARKVRPWNNMGFFEYPPENATKPDPDKPCEAFVSRVWDWRTKGLHRHKYAYWCENCWAGIDYAHAGEFWGGKHIKGDCIAIIADKRVYFDRKWQRWVIDSSEVDGFVGDDVTCCLADRFAEVWGTYACEFFRIGSHAATIGSSAQCVK